MSSLCTERIGLQLSVIWFHSADFNVHCNKNIRPGLDFGVVQGKYFLQS